MVTSTVAVIHAAVGFRAKTGRAIAVVLSGSIDDPAFVWRGEVSLVDPAIPATAEPYHDVMELPWPEAVVAAQRLESAIQAIANARLRELIARMRSSNVDVRAIGVVGSPRRNVETIGNPHIRAHAAEGMLFRAVLENAAAANTLHCRAFSDREIGGNAPERAKTLLNQMRRAAGPPWRSDERLAATAAWMALGR